MVKKTAQTEIEIRLTPRAAKNEITGKEGEVYRVKVTSPPIDGKANKALIELVSKRLGIPKRDIEMITGQRSRLKTLLIHSLSLAEVKAKLDG
jgi:uncharacterized protein (TIGR00251 family)